MIPDIFNVLAEISIAFVGFSAIVVVLQQQGGKSNTEFQRFGSKIIIEIGFSCVFFSLLPTIILLFDRTSAHVWQISTALFGLFLIVYWSLYMLRRSPVTKTGRVSPISTWFRVGLTWLFGLSLLLASVGLTFVNAIALYTTALVWQIGLGAIIFLIIITIVQDADDAG
jgi:hypothetical protein